MSSSAANAPPLHKQKPILLLAGVGIVFVGLISIFFAHEIIVIILMTQRLRDSEKIDDRVGAISQKIAVIDTTSSCDHPACQCLREGKKSYRQYLQKLCAEEKRDPCDYHHLTLNHLEVLDRHLTDTISRCARLNR